MAATAIPTTGIKRAQPLVKQLFRNVMLHKPAPEKELFINDKPHMILLLPWLGAKEKISQKFINQWNDHGFNVMHITTQVSDLLMPRTKSEVTVQRTLDYLMNSNHRIMIHGISVGAYIGTRMVMESLKTDLKPRITHQIFDSFTSPIGLQAGVQHAVPYPILSNIASAFGRAYYKYADCSVIHGCEKFLATSPATIPTYYMHSLADHVAQYNLIEHWIEAQSKKSPTSLLLIPETRKVGHVNLFRVLGEKRYMSCIFKFLRRNNFDIHTEFAINEETRELGTMENEFVPQ